ncbi:MAG: hypothetical protein ACI9Z9_000792, partial [Litorivivens sp.]
GVTQQNDKLFCAVLRFFKNQQSYWWIIAHVRKRNFIKGIL